MRSAIAGILAGTEKGDEAALVEGGAQPGHGGVKLIHRGGDAIGRAYRYLAEGIEDIGVMQANHPLTNSLARVQVATVQTLAKRQIPDASLVLIDEAHIRAEVLDDLMMAHDGNKAVRFVGLSATPWRKGMGRVWQDLVIPITVKELIDGGFLSQFTAFAPDVPDLSGVKVSKGEYVESQLAELMGEAKLVGHVVENWLANGQNLPTLCFGVNRNHAQEMAASFERAGVASAYVDAFTDTVERGRINRKFRDGEIRVICSVRTMTTGVDLPVSCIVDAAPTKSEMLHCLDSKTEILTSRGWKGIGQVAVGDCVASCIGTDGEPGYGTARLRMPTASGFGYTGTDMTGTAKLLQGIAALGADSAYAGGGARLALAIIAQTDELVPEIGTFAAIGTQWLESTASFPHGGFHSEALCGVAFDGAVSPGVPLRAAGRLGTSLKASLRVLEALHTAGALSGDMRGTTVLDVALVSGGTGNAALAGLLIVTGQLDTGGVVAATIGAGRTTDEHHDAAASADLQLTPQQILTAALQALGHIGAEMGMPGQNVSVWSVNAETGASAAYEDYPFNSFATIGGRHFGAASDGVYELVGDDDAGMPIQAHLNLGKRNFGTSKLKAMPYAYLGVASGRVQNSRMSSVVGLSPRKNRLMNSPIACWVACIIASVPESR